MQPSKRKRNFLFTLEFSYLRGSMTSQHGASSGCDGGTASNMENSCKCIK